MGRTRTLGQWIPVVGAASVLLVVVLVGASGDDSPDDVSVVTTTSVAQVVTGATYKPVPKVPLSQTLGRGAASPEVKMIQERLIELAFDPGVADGAFGERTQRAIWAFEKLVMKVPFDQVTGKVTKEMWSRMQDPLLILPRRPNATPNHTEIYLPQQVLIVFHDDVPVLITHISSGDGQEWCEEVTISPGEMGNETGLKAIKRGVCGVSFTPGGVFKYHRLYLGKRESQLGSMYNPVYFNKGIAVHGSKDVPKRPASHGCIRIPLHISDYFQTLVTKGEMVFVFDGKKQPEEYGAQSPIFNRPDPNYTTTSTSTTSTTTPKTTTTTKPPVTTVPPPPPETPPTTLIAP
ncbi:MAG: L,D-transpeptidase family protein [Ilumatobacteraceae bacterium]